MLESPIEVLAPVVESEAGEAPAAPAFRPFWADRRPSKPHCNGWFYGVGHFVAYNLAEQRARAERPRAPRRPHRSSSADQRCAPAGSGDGPVDADDLPPETGGGIAPGDPLLARFVETGLSV